MWKTAQPSIEVKRQIFRLTMRLVLLHHHIFKNAGSTLDCALERHFGSAFSEFHADMDPEGRVSPAQLYEYLDSSPDLQAVSSHHFYGRQYNKDQYFDGHSNYRFFDCILVRHPLPRLVSIYSFLRSLKTGNGGIFAASRELGLPDFLNYLIKDNENYVLSPQVRLIGGDDFSALPDRFTMQTAALRLSRMAVTGTVERYAETMTLGEYFLEPVFPGITFHSPRSNISNKNDLDGYDGSTASLKDVIGDSLYYQLLELNQFDVELWQFATDEIDRRASYVPDFDDLCADFKERCAWQDAARRAALLKLESASSAF